MPEMLAAFAPMLFEAGAEAAPGALSAAAPEALAAGAETVAPAAFGSAAGLGSAGLPFAAGAGELGSVATGLGPAGVSAFGDAAGIASAFGASSLPFASATAGAGLPFAAGAGEIGSTMGSGLNSAISGVSAAPAGLGDAILPANSSLTSATGPSAFNPGLGAGASIDPAAASGASGQSAFDTAAPVSNWTGDVAPTTPAGTSASAAPAGASASGGGISDWLSKNAATLGIGGLGIGAALASPFLSRSLSPQLPNQPQLTANAQSAQKQADALQGQEATLTAPLTTGVLPEAQQVNLDSVTNDAINSVKSKYASMGLSGSTMELEAINNVKNNAAATKVSIESSLAATGLQMGNQALTAMGLTDGIYTSLMNATLSQDKALQDAIAKMAGSAAQGSALGTAINSKPSSTASAPLAVAA